MLRIALSTSAGETWTPDLAGALRLDADQDHLVEDCREHLAAQTFLLVGGGGAQPFVDSEAAGLLQFKQGDDLPVDDGGNPVDHDGRRRTGGQYQGRGEGDGGAGGRKGAADRSHASTCIRHSVPPRQARVRQTAIPGGASGCT